MQDGRLCFGSLEYGRGLILIASLTGKSLFIFDNYFAFFSFGALVSIYEEEKTALNITPMLLSIGLCFYAEYKIDVATHHVQDKAALICYGLIALFVLFFFLLITKKGSNIKIPYSYTLGALTYPVYLIHAHAGFVMISMFATKANKAYVYPLVIVAIFAVAWCMHVVIEVKLKSTWKRFFEFLLYPARYLENKLK